MNLYFLLFNRALLLPFYSRLDTGHDIIHINLNCIRCARSWFEEPARKKTLTNTNSHGQIE